MKKILFILAALGLLYTSCKKMDVSAPTLDITINKTTLKLGDTVKFSLTGSADYISFYSGELGRNYNNINTYTGTGGNPEMQFTSNVQLGTTTINNLSVLVSSDFNGIYDQANITSATWTNVTNRVVLGTTATNVSSGVANLNDLKVDGSPMYVAFRYLSSQPATLKQRQWTVSAFQFRTKFPNGTVYTHAADNTTAGFGTYSFAGDSARWVTGTSLTHVALNAGYPGDDDWAITKPFDLSKINSDASGVVIVKNLITGSVPPAFNWVFTTAGSYTAVFVIRNANAQNTKEVIKTFDITITP